MAQERVYSKEDDSAWKSWFFKFGVMVAVIGALIKSTTMMAVGGISMGGAWALWRGK